MSRYKSFLYFNLFNACLLTVTLLAFLLIVSISYAKDKEGTIGGEEIYFQLLEGTKLYYENQYSQTVEALSSVIANKPDPKIFYPAIVHRGAAWGYLGQKEKALRDFEDALKINNQDPFLYYMRAVTVFALQKEFDRAIEDLNYALTLNPYPSLALSTYLSRSNYYAQKKEFHLARDDLNQALRLDPDRAADIILQTGLSAYNQNQYEWAINILDQVITYKPDPKTFYSAMVHRGAAWGYLGQKEKALRDFEDALKINNQDPILYYMRAVTVFALQKEFDRAIEDLNYALTLNPYPSLALSTYLSRSNYYAQKKEFHLARDDLNQALRLDPHNKAIYATIKNLADLYSAKGDILKRKGQYDQAVEYYSEAILLNPQNNRPFSGRAFSRILKGDKKEAIQDLQYACQLGHKNACHILDILEN